MFNNMLLSAGDTWSWCCLVPLIDGLVLVMVVCSTVQPHKSYDGVCEKRSIADSITRRRPVEFNVSEANGRIKSVSLELDLLELELKLSATDTRGKTKTSTKNAV